MHKSSNEIPSSLYNVIVLLTKKKFTRLVLNLGVLILLYNDPRLPHPLRHRLILFSYFFLLRLKKIEVFFFYQEWVSVSGEILNTIPKSFLLDAVLETHGEIFAAWFASKREKNAVSSSQQSIKLGNQACFEFTLTSIMHELENSFQKVKANSVQKLLQRIRFIRKIKWIQWDSVKGLEEANEKLFPFIKKLPWITYFYTSST